MGEVLQQWLDSNGRSQKWLAAELGVRPPSVHAWLQRGVPAKRVMRVSELTGIPREKLRPDIYGAAHVAA